MIYLKGWKRRTYNQEYSTQQDLFGSDGEIKSFTDKQKLTKFSTANPALQQILKELLYAGNTRQGKDLHKISPKQF